MGDTIAELARFFSGGIAQFNLSVEDLAYWRDKAVKINQAENGDDE